MCYEKILGYSGAFERTATVPESVLSHRYCVLGWWGPKWNGNTRSGRPISTRATNDISITKSHSAPSLFSQQKNRPQERKIHMGNFFFHSILVLYIEFFSTRQNGDITHWTLHIARSVGPVSSNSPTCRCLACSGGRDSVSTEGFQKDVKYITVMIDTADVSKPLPQ